MTKTIPPPTMIRTAAAIQPKKMTGSLSGLPGLGCAWWGASGPLRDSTREAGRAAVGAATRAAEEGGETGRAAGEGRAGLAGAGRGEDAAAGRAAPAFAAWRFASQEGQRMRSDVTAPEGATKSFPHISHFGMDGSLSGGRARTAGAALLAESLLEHLAEPRRLPDRARAAPAGPEHYRGGDGEGEQEDAGEGEGDAGLRPAEAGHPEVAGEDVGDLPELPVPGLVPDRAVEDPLDLDDVAAQLEPLRTVGEIERHPVRGVGLRQEGAPDVLAPGERPLQAGRDPLGFGEDPPHPHELAAEEIRRLQGLAVVEQAGRPPRDLLGGHRPEDLEEPAVGVRLLEVRPVRGVEKRPLEEGRQEAPSLLPPLLERRLGGRPFPGDGDLRGEDALERVGRAIREQEPEGEDQEEQEGETKGTADLRAPERVDRRGRLEERPAPGRSREGELRGEGIHRGPVRARVGPGPRAGALTWAGPVSAAPRGAPRRARPRGRTRTWRCPSSSRC